MKASSVYVAAALLVAGLLIALFSVGKHDPDGPASGPKEPVARLPGRTHERVERGLEQDPAEPLDTAPRKLSVRPDESLLNDDEIINTLKKQIEGLEACQEQDRVTYAAALPINENPVSAALWKYAGARVEFELMVKEGMKPDSPEFQTRYAGLSQLLEDAHCAVDQVDQQLRVQLIQRRSALLLGGK